MSNRHIVYMATLIRKSISGEITAEERKLLEEWLNESLRHRELFEKYNNPAFLSSIDLEKDLEESQEAYLRFMNRVKSKNTVRKFVWTKYVAAAVLVAFVSAAAITMYLYNVGKPNSPSELAVVSDAQKEEAWADTTDILLITAGGEKIPLQSSEKMLSVSSGSIKIGEKAIEERAQVKTSESEVVYNTLKILRGKRFKMQLSDGTLVWLNADSEITFPSSFVGKERKVLAKGELFFDVTEEKANPFIVETPIGKIRVLGTAFNVYCYQDEVPRTTLVRGKIAYSLGKDSLVMTSGQQCVVEDNKLSVREVDTYEYVSWIDEVLVFKDKELEEIMNSLSRLYDVDISYEHPELKRLPFTGSFKQYENLDKIIRMIEECGLIHIRQDGNTLVVSK